MSATRCWTARSTGWPAMAAGPAPSSRATGRSRCKGLYLAGGAAHPGPGMPMVMMSGWIAADALDQDLGGRGMSAAAELAGQRDALRARAGRRVAMAAPGGGIAGRAVLPGALRLLRFMFAGFARKHLRAVRVAHWGLPPPDDAGRPLVVYANHPSWWDGVAFMLYSTELFPGRRMFIPMEAAALRRYGFMRRHRRLRGGAAVGARGGGLPADGEGGAGRARAHMLWMNAPGRFMDVRERPVPMAPGLVRLAELAPDARFLPMAIEYPFWSERSAEMLCGFGPPIEGADLAGAGPRGARRGPGPRPGGDDGPPGRGRHGARPLPFPPGAAGPRRHGRHLRAAGAISWPSPAASPSTPATTRAPEEAHENPQK